MACLISVFKGGKNGIIIDPEVGDIGLCAIANRDISKIKATKAEAMPGSNRTFSLSDGIYLGGCLNGSPDQFIQFNSSGITITSPTNVTINATNGATVNTNSATVVAQSLTVTCPMTTFSGNVTINGLLTGSAGLAISGGAGSQFTGNVTHTGGVMSSNGIMADSHIHGGVQPGTGNSGSPV